MNESSQLGEKANGREHESWGHAGLKNQWRRYSVSFFPFPREACLLIRCRELTKTQESICLLECGNTTPVKHDTTIYYSAILVDFLLS